MPRPTKDTVEFSANVPKDEYDTFKNNFPQYGAVKWFINESLSAFNRKVEENPGLKEVVDDAIDHMMEVSRAITTIEGAKKESA